MPDEKPQFPKVTWPFVLVFMSAEAITLALVLGFYWYLTQTFAGNVEDVRKVINEQASAWNRGDLEGYMAGYWKSDELRFFGGADVTTGWQGTLDNYRKKYQGEGKEMGKLTFADVRVAQHSDKDATASGHWQLDFSDQTKSEGLFTLILHRFGSEWRIIHDHSSGKPRSNRTS
jgi:beta-aspartyl-peptidase (threonine type)